MKVGAAIGGLRAKAETSQQYSPATRKCGENVVEEVDCVITVRSSVFRILVGRPIRSDFHICGNFQLETSGTFPVPNGC